jgi:hypothetical protein
MLLWSCSYLKMNSSYSIHLHLIQIIRNKLTSQSNLFGSHYNANSGLSGDLSLYSSPGPNKRWRGLSPCH